MPDPGRRSPGGTGPLAAAATSAEHTHCHHRGEDGARGRLVDSLDPASLVIIAALRAWVAPHRAPDLPAPDWRAAFRLLGASSVMVDRFDALMWRVRHGMRRPLDIRCCACPRVGADEEVLLQLIGALQRGDRLAALDGLTDCLGEAAPPALGTASALAAVLGEAGLRIAAASQARRPQRVPRVVSRH